MNSSGRVKKRSSTTTAEQRPFSSHFTRSKSHSKKSSKSPGGKSTPHNLPPIDTQDPKTPPKAPTHTYKRNRKSDNIESDDENQENEEEQLNREDVQADALQALASYMAFQRMLLRHIEIDPSFTEFTYQDYSMASVETAGFHSGRSSEDFVPDASIGTGNAPSTDIERREL
ncbi:hypothetical protein N431DRAFT_461262 [Stipitochalara longipes BDJ]|nr:hypothetical protein N431DRAFT_461262 [Stipitochalara longipes BDJ]